MRRAVTSVYPKDILDSNLLYKQHENKILQYLMQFNANEINAMMVKALHNVCVFFFIFERIFFLVFKILVRQTNGFFLELY